MADENELQNQINQKLDVITNKIESIRILPKYKSQIAHLLQLTSFSVALIQTLKDLEIQKRKEIHEKSILRIENENLLIKQQIEEDKITHERELLRAHEIAMQDLQNKHIIDMREMLEETNSKYQIAYVEAQTKGKIEYAKVVAELKLEEENLKSDHAIEASYASQKINERILDDRVKYEEKLFDEIITLDLKSEEFKEEIKGFSKDDPKQYAKWKLHEDDIKHRDFLKKLYHEMIVSKKSLF